MANKKKRKKRFKPRGEKKAVEFLFVQLNRKNLEYLFGLCAGMSAVSHFVNPIEEPAGRYIHYQTCRVLADTIVRSTASFEHEGVIRVEDLVKVVNNANDACDDLTMLPRLAEANGTKRAPLEVLRFLSRLGQVQIASGEEDPTVMAARTIGLTEVIPEAFRDEIKEKVAGVSNVLDVQAEEILSMPVRQLADVYADFFVKLQKKWEHMERLIPWDENEHQTVVGMLKVMNDLARKEFWSFPWRRMVRERSYEEMLDKFLSIFSCEIEDIRQLTSKSPYSEGAVSVRLNPLDRYPIVRISSDRFVIPNVTIFVKSFPYVVDFSMLDYWSKMGSVGLYNQMRGAVLEIYVRELISDRFPDYVLIPEREYRSSGGAKRGPDLCVLDAENCSLIAIEVKARRLSPTVAVMPGDEELDWNHGDSIQAIKKMKEKIQEMRRKPEFANWRELFKKIPEEREVYVSVVSGTIFMHEEVESMRASLDESHPLYAFEKPSCVMDLPVFERAVEVASYNNMPLWGILLDYFEDSRRHGIEAPAARLFRNRDVPPFENRFVNSFL